MMISRKEITRRKFLADGSTFTAGLAVPRGWVGGDKSRSESRAPLSEFDYSNVTLHSDLHEQQLRENISVLMQLSDDSLLKPLRAMSGQPAPGEELGGWYLYTPNFDVNARGWPGFAPAGTFGQWVSALARAYAITRDEKLRLRVLRLNQLYAKTITTSFYENNRFPAYCFDKIVCGLMDSQRFAGDSTAWKILDHTADIATQKLPGKAIEHGRVWRPDKEKDNTYTWDESYTMPENLFLSYHRGAGKRYREMAEQYLDDEYFGPLSEGHSNFEGRHAYSHVNSLCSAIQAYMTLGSEKHLRAAANGFNLLQAQSFATGGWGPDETLREPDSDEIYKSLTGSHSSFETPCGSYAHFKLTRYLLRVTRDSKYGDSMERVMYNTVLGAKPLRPDGSTFYYSDYNFRGRKVYSPNHWACCSGTLPQVAADYRVNTYLRDDDGVYVNLYIPSTLNWEQDGADVSLRQRTTYPFDSHIEMEITASRASDFALRLRIPAWTQKPSVRVNGKRIEADVQPGTFAPFRREWKSGDRVVLELPMPNRLEAIDARYPETVALLCGPLVLFAVGDKAPNLSRQQLLAASKTGQQTWQAATSTEALKLLPFTSITDEPYTTYVRVS